MLWHPNYFTIGWHWDHGAKVLFPLQLRQPDQRPQGKKSSLQPEPEFVNLLRSPGIDSQPGGPLRQPCLALYRTGPPGYLGWRSRFLGIDSLDLIPRLLKRLQTRARWCSVSHVTFCRVLFCILIRNYYAWFFLQTVHLKLFWNFPHAISLPYLNFRLHVDMRCNASVCSKRLRPRLLFYKCIKE